MTFVAFALVLATIGLVLQALNIDGWFHSADEVAHTRVVIAALIYVVPAVAAIGANILTQYVTAGP